MKRLVILLALASGCHGARLDGFHGLGGAEPEPVDSDAGAAALAVSSAMVMSGAPTATLSPGRACRR